jgi:4-amino-4-deoxy-L-arabinose transferase-like glycosyltransferase
MKKDRYLYIILALALIALLVNLNSWSVIEASEARYAEISREMFRSGDLFHPSLLNIYHYHKPPFTFWLTGLGFQLFGVNAFGARFFLQLSLIVQGLLVYLISIRLFGENMRSLLATIIYISFPLSLMGARNFTTDSFLTTLVLAVIYCMTTYYFKHQVWAIYGMAIFIGIGFLTKGPAIFVVPFFYWLYLMLSRQVDYRVPIKHLLIAFLLCITLGLSWYVYVGQQVPHLTDYFLGRQLVARVLDDQAFDRAKPAWYYALILSTTTLPWFLIYLASLFRPSYRLFKMVEARQLSLYWLLLPFLIFQLSSSKLMMYLLPIYPGLAIILACLLTNMVGSDLKRFTQAFFGLYLALGAIALLGVPIAKSLGVDIIVTWQMTLSGLLVIVMPLLTYRLERQRPKLRLGLISLFSILAFIIYGGYFIGANELLIGGTRPLAQFIQAQGLKDQTIIVYNKLLPSLAFNLDRDIITINDGGIERETQFQTDEQWRKFWIYTSEPEAMNYLQSLVKKPSVLVTRTELSDQCRSILESYSQSKVLGKWTIFYQR